MGNKLFVGGLSWDTTDQSLRAAFEQCGTVMEAKVITDRDSGRSRGFGFVTLGSSEEAQNAIQQLDGSEIDGRSVRVNEAEDKRGGGGGGGGGGGRGGGRRNDRW
jgi:cold-inducible RNA-binding protein